MNNTYRELLVGNLDMGLDYGRIELHRSHGKWPHY